MIATIELNDNVDVNALPDGIYAQVAVYSDHFTHVSVMRKVLLRMTSWVHYLYLDPLGAGYFAYHFEPGTLISLTQAAVPAPE